MKANQAQIDRFVQVYLGHLKAAILTNPDEHHTRVRANPELIAKKIAATLAVNVPAEPSAVLRSTCETLGIGTSGQAIYQWLQAPNYVNYTKET